MAPKEVDAERWWDMLEVLPPSRWTRAGGTESFHVCEYLSGNFVSWFVRIGERYFELQDVDTMKHGELVALCQQVAA
jgi:hypothetical protein